MKKSIIKNISMLLTFVLLLSTLLSISVHAISTSCVEDHFTNLITTGTGSSEVIRTPPSEYSCSYTAMSMLLSFYDSYWRDDFIVSADGINETDWEQGIYDPSTDTLIETFSASEEAQKWSEFANSDKSNYNEFVIHPDYDHYLESYLIALAKEIDLCEDDATVFGLQGYEIVELLEYYLYDVRGFTEDQITVHIEREVDIGSSDETLFEQMVNHINDGFPLIYAGYDWDIDFSQIEFFDQIQEQIGGHAMIAYSFDGTFENPTDINLHTGWSGNEHSQSVNETKYRFWNLIIWLEINEENLPHVCSDAYVDSVTDETYCACEVYCGSHPNGTHAAGNGYLSYTNAGHNKPCKRCNEPIFASHSYTHTPCNNNNYHSSTCACGYTKTSAHIVDIPSGNVKIGTCILCGASVTIGNGTIMPWGDNGGNSGTYVMNNSVQYITENGSYLLPEGIIIISDADYELYLSGELDLNGLVCSN